MPATVVSSPFLVYRDGGGHQQLVPLEARRERLTVGRGQQTDLWLEWDAQASRLHAAFERLGGDWTVVSPVTRLSDSPELDYDAALSAGLAALLLDRDDRHGQGGRASIRSLAGVLEHG